MAGPRTVRDILNGAPHEASAIRAPGRPPLDYDGLQTLSVRVVEWLNALGVGRGDRVAIVLPNGPEAAAAFLTVAACATTAPLNPAYRAEEFEFHLADLKAKALIVQAGLDGPARAVAQRRAIPVIELAPRSGGPAGLFDLWAAPSEGERAAADGFSGGFSGPDDVALVLHTSGTTSRPKIVPLTQRNLCASAENIARTFALGPSDSCLNVMPLFHIHGLVASVLSSLAAHGSVFCAPGFDALKFFSWLEEARPTWYTAVPAMHQAILARAERNREVAGRARLRFVRSSSAPLPPQVMRRLEETFGAPVVEAYGMTEAAHQMASNPLPPRPRKPGTVGLAAGPEVAVMDEAGTILAPGRRGEIVIRGENVTPGYDGAPEANAKAFAGGWFRTGDEGMFDEDGYLTITGRIKEIINRGGEKIAPREVDEALLDHPAVEQAVTFAMPHPMLGEDVAAAVVLKEGGRATDRELREFVARRLADFKVPRRILILDEIPKGPTGKPRRIGLAGALGLS